LLNSPQFQDFKTLLDQLRTDIGILTEFINLACEPYRKLFKKLATSEALSGNLKQLAETFVATNEGLNKTIRKMLGYVQETSTTTKSRNG
jgi:hypothetical protein